jgi:hypothetical protein
MNTTRADNSYNRLQIVERTGGSEVLRVIGAPGGGLPINNSFS